MYVHTCTHLGIHVSMYMHVYIYIYTCIYVYIHTHIYIYTYIRMIPPANLPLRRLDSSNPLKDFQSK